MKPTYPTIDIFNLAPLFNNGELETEREANKCPYCKCLFAWDAEFCSDECEGDFNEEKKHEEDKFFLEDFDEEQNF